mmetsp:Transcript_32615/g.82257  ORF Transcript_32615/g.82257 Transcript_32615/m.82257 type:complete len:322 (+) Transcript_32615:1268-2233(+)
MGKLEASLPGPCSAMIGTTSNSAASNSARSQPVRKLSTTTLARLYNRITCALLKPASGTSCAPGGSLTRVGSKKCGASGSYSTSSSLAALRGACRQRRASSTKALAMGGLMMALGAHACVLAKYWVRQSGRKSALSALSSARGVRSCPRCHTAPSVPTVRITAATSRRLSPYSGTMTTSCGPMSHGASGSEKLENSVAYAALPSGNTLPMVRKPVSASWLSTWCSWWSASGPPVRERTDVWSKMRPGGGGPRSAAAVRRCRAGLCCRSSRGLQSPGAPGILGSPPLQQASSVTARYSAEGSATVASSPMLYRRPPPPAAAA